MEEIFKDVKGYEGLYQVSNLGNIINSKNGRKIKLNITERGYYRVNLYKEKKENHFKVHRLVAIAFIENINNKPQVNHIDGIKTNNNVSNLEWSTSSENIRHAINVGLIDVSNLQRTMREKMSISVIDKSNGIIYKSITEASKYCQISPQYLSKMLKGYVPNITNITYFK
jgi:hypothetical protein